MSNQLTQGQFNRIQSGRRARKVYALLAIIAMVGGLWMIRDKIFPTASGQELPSFNGITIFVYHAVEEQTDDTPMETADGTDLNGVDIASARYCALSRDLLSRWGGPIDYGDAIQVHTGDPSVDGMWEVHDAMADRHKMSVDLLVPEGVLGKWNNATIVHIGHISES